VQTTIDSFGGYPCIGDEYYECRVLPDGELMYPSKHPDLYNLLVQLASLEHIPFKPE
jgi:hypothetical protein